MWCCQMSTGLVLIFCVGNSSTTSFLVFGYIKVVAAHALHGVCMWR